MNKRRIVTLGISILLIVLALSTTALAGPASEQKAGIFVAIASVLTNPIIRTILLTLGVLGILVEIMTLTGLWGSLGIVSLLFFFGSHITMGYAPTWVIAVFAIGVALFAIEVFVTPGFGFLGLTGALAMLASVILTIPDPVQGGVSVTIAALVSGGIFVYLLKYLPRSKAWDRIILSEKQSSSDGYNSVKVRRDLEGAVGVTACDLRPAGVALINDERIDVVSSGGFVKKDTTVQVIKVEGVKVIVEPAERNW